MLISSERARNAVHMMELSSHQTQVSVGQAQEAAQALQGIGQRVNVIRDTADSNVGTGNRSSESARSVA